MSKTYDLSLDEIFNRMFTWANPNMDLALNSRSFAKFELDNLLNLVGHDEILYIFKNKKPSNENIKEQVEHKEQTGYMYVERIIDLSKFISKAESLRYIPLIEMGRQTKKDYLNIIRDLQLGARAQPSLLYLSSIVSETLVPTDSELRTFAREKIQTIEEHNEKLRAYAINIVRKKRGHLIVAYENDLKEKIKNVFSRESTQNSLTR
jgi:hypothetical protein